ncbi:FAD-dependent oxidoreductase [Arenibacter aquaticus]|uniref:FAD-dependent oxidoreductase n=1 Tax=Arenibacter aquaticus TaxID=2489054 RepID=A0A3S0AZT4_9FLAO|nr:FAD-dependent oxidoreductase [Arenibacter aquaticus]RTE54282.1 FAD-dependent oxidoreductase [Arenibacter aquaticus]
MKRRNFFGNLAAGSGLLLLNPIYASHGKTNTGKVNTIHIGERTIKADLVIIGGGTGGCATALGALRNGLTVIMTEETDWIGGQLTQQGVPPDEHKWINDIGATALYREFRKKVRAYYRNNYPLKAELAKKERFNPGNASVSEISHEPKISLRVLETMFDPYISAGKLVLLKETVAVDASTQGNKVQSVRVKNLSTGETRNLVAPYFADATELGDLLPLTGAEYVTGAEAKSDTGELHAAAIADPTNNQAFTVCFAMDYRPNEDWTIERPEEYGFWRNYRPEMKSPWAGKLLELNYSNPRTLAPKNLGFDPRGNPMKDVLNLWIYRRILAKDNFEEGFLTGDITLVNYPQNDYFLGNIVDVGEKELKHHVSRAKQLSLSLLYWLQTEAPRADGGKGWPGIRLRHDVMGTTDGLAKYPYIRESRRIKPLFRITEHHVGRTQRASIQGVPESEAHAQNFEDSVGIGYYHIDLHPSSGGDNYIDFSSLPFQIPLGALIPQRMENIFPVSKNIGTTHLTNGCYRLHPVEWSIGEAIGMFVPFLMETGRSPQEIYQDTAAVRKFQGLIRSQGVDTHWPYERM